MNIIGFVKRFGDKSFKEMPFNEVDALIFSELSYINFDLAITDHKFHPFSRIHIKDKKAFYTGSVDASYNEKLVTLMIKSKRYKSLRIGFCKSCRDEKDFTQFFAFTILFPDKTGFISMRGTDTSLLGWREDFTIMYQDDMPSQEMAADYVNKVSKHFDANFYIGGHSKGGNLAIYAALHLNEKVEDRLIRVYSFDGPGFRSDITQEPAFSRIEERINKYLTTNDMIGVIYNRITNPLVVYSQGILLGGHDPFRWKVNKNGESFFYGSRSKRSQSFENGVMNWLTTTSDMDKELAVNVLFRLLGDSTNIYDLLLKSFRLVRKAKDNLKDYSSIQIARTIEIYKRLGQLLFRSYAPRKYLVKKTDELEEENNN